MSEDKKYFHISEILAYVVGTQYVMPETSAQVRPDGTRRVHQASAIEPLFDLMQHTIGVDLSTAEEFDKYTPEEVGQFFAAVGDALTQQLPWLETINNTRVSFDTDMDEEELSAHIVNTIAAAEMNGQKIGYWHQITRGTMPSPRSQADADWGGPAGGGMLPN